MYMYLLFLFNIGNMLLNILKETRYSFLTTKLQ